MNDLMTCDILIVCPAQQKNFAFQVKSGFYTDIFLQ